MASLEQQNPIPLPLTNSFVTIGGNLSQTVQIQGKVAASQNWERLNNKIEAAQEKTPLLFVRNIFIFIFHIL